MPEKQTRTRSFRICTGELNLDAVPLLLSRFKETETGFALCHPTYTEISARHANRRRSPQRCTPRAFAAARGRRSFCSSASAALHSNICR